jgi:hypothetical protein
VSILTAYWRWPGRRFLACSIIQIVLQKAFLDISFISTILLHLQDTILEKSLAEDVILLARSR